MSLAVSGETVWVSAPASEASLAVASRLSLAATSLVMALEATALAWAAALSCRRRKRTARPRSVACARRMAA